MSTYISMLRGINITGHKIIRMVELKALYESIGFADVTTYIQSGNVVFKSKGGDPSALAGRISDAVRTKFGFDVTVVVRTPREMATAISKNPFVGRKTTDDTRLYVTFLDTKPAPALVKGLAPLVAKSKDEYEVIGREIYLHCPHGYGETLLSNTFFEKNLKVPATTRNWNTVRKLLSIAEGGSSSRSE